MRIVAGFIVLLLLGCTPGEDEVFTTSANVDLASIPGMLAAIDDVTENDLAVGDLAELTNSVPLDEEKQERFVVSHNGVETELLYHVWREQADWVHVYASSTSKQLIDEVESSMQHFARATED